VAIQSILRTPAGKADSQPLPTNLSIIKAESTGRVLRDSADVIAQVEYLEIKALSPEPTLPPRAPFPWLALAPLLEEHTTPMLSGRIPLEHTRGSLSISKQQRGGAGRRAGHDLQTHASGIP